MNILNSEIIKTKQKLRKDKISYFVFAIYFLMVLLLSSVFFVGKKFNIPFEKITGDPALTFKSHPFIGFLSNIGALIWCYTASICFFSALILFKTTDKKKALFFMCSGIFTSILLIDDFFMFHDYIFYTFINSDIVQLIVYIAYAIFLFWYILRFLKFILSTLYIFLVLAIGFFGLSVLTDLIFKSKGLQYFIEDSFKFIGLINWMLFFSITAYNALLHKLQPLEIKNS
ncbi:hypothetical protein [Mariniflexile sp. HMF6888]|uniref:hypothetical protein n=1 Tax=Mariniflexile sp. HMF6888 TaxID=3373086 RepID=UPI00379BD6A4